MSEQSADLNKEPDRLREFTQELLADLQALERMIAENRIESGVRRIGAEQEMFLVDGSMRPATRALSVLKSAQHPQLTTELALFNLEANLSPLLFEGDCLSRMEREIDDMLSLVRTAARESDTRVLLTGILPTLRQNDLSLDAITPAARYRELNRMCVEHRGGSFRVKIRGLDELNVTHDNVLFEACNTSFQVHFQVGPEEAVRLYNLAQAVAGPVLAAAVNSPVLMQRRLWQETRLALFQQSVDTRSDTHQARHARPRVIFGNRWVDRSILEIFRDDIARFRVFLACEKGESPLEMLDRGELPPLNALCRHNGTVYRWNRLCYGVNDGKAHLRIEHRPLPAGPSVIDEVANAAFFFGLMIALQEHVGDVTKVMAFDDAKTNFMAAARYGLKARLQWIHGRAHSADQLILKRLIPAAREGLISRGISADDVERYLGVLEQRVRTGRTGSQWFLDSLAAMGDQGKVEERYRTITSKMHDCQLGGRPVHEWPLAEAEKHDDWDSYRTVEQVMTTDLFTVGPDDLVNLAASLMDWEHIRHVPVEDKHGHLVGLVSYRQLLRMVGQGLSGAGVPVAVRELMIRDPVTVGPDCSTVDAIETMRENRVSSLCVTDGQGTLLGIITERDFIQITAKLLDQKLRDP